MVTRRRSSPTEQRRHNLSSELSTFIGREWELDELAILLRSARLVTLTGPGGVGKTRLALRLARAQLDLQPDGVWLAELGSVADPILVPQALATALGIQQDGRRPVHEVLCEYLSRRDLMLVLDNCEHLVSACAELAYNVLRACPGARMLATSREPLSIEGETVWRVSLLRVPGRSTVRAKTSR